MRLRSWLTVTSLAVGLLVCVTMASTHAAPSREIISFHCRLVQNGTPVSGTHSLTFDVWNAEALGTNVHTETQSVTVSHGLVAVRLGEQPGNEITGVFSANDDLWVSVSLGGQDLLGTRIRLTAVPYSMNAARANGLWDSSSGSTQTLTQLDTRYVVASSSGDTSNNTQISGPTVAGADLFLEAPGDGVTRGTIVVQDPILINNHLLLNKLTTAPVGSSGKVALYAKTDGKLYFKDGTGGENEVGAGSGNYIANGFRLTLSSGVPVPTADVSGTTLYLTPYKSNEIWTKVSGTWTKHTSAEIPASVPTFTSGCQDVFVYWTGSGLALEFQSWANYVSRATNQEPIREDGILVRADNVSGVRTADPTRRYLGTILFTGTVWDTHDYRALWNYYNQVEKVSQKVMGSAWDPGVVTGWTWTGNPSTFAPRYFVLGFPAHVRARAHVTVNTYGGAAALVYLSLDAAGGNGAVSYHSGYAVDEASVSYASMVPAGWHGIVPRHTTGAATWFGAGGYLYVESRR